MKKFAAAAVLSMVFAMPGFAAQHRPKRPKPVHPQQQQHAARRPKAIHPQQRRPSAKRPEVIPARKPHFKRLANQRAGGPRGHHFHLWPFHKRR